MLALTMATAGGAWDNAKKWCERCAVEGAPVPGQRGRITFTQFGVKKMSNFDALLNEHGIEAFVKDSSMLPIVRSKVRYAALFIRDFYSKTYSGSCYVDYRALLALRSRRNSWTRRTTSATLLS